MDTTGRLQAPLLTEMELECPQKRHATLGQTMVTHMKMLVATAVLTVAITVALFVGGFYLGHNNNSSSQCATGTGAGAASSSSPAPSMAATTPMVQLAIAGTSLQLSTIAGMVPVQSFMECVSVVRSPSQVSCMPVNTILTPAGTFLVALYQYNSDTSLIMTATGSAFGSATYADTVEANFTLTVQGLPSTVVSSQLPLGSVTLSGQGQYSVNMVVRATDSVNVVFSHVTLSASLLASVSAQGSTGSLSLAVLDSSLQTVRIGNMPTAATPLIVSWPFGEVPPTASPSAPTTSQLYASSGITVSQVTSGVVRRSVGNASAHEFIVDLRDSTGTATHRFHIRHDSAHGLSLAMNISTLDRTGAVNDSLALGVTGNEQILPTHGLVLNTSNLLTTTHRLHNSKHGCVYTIESNKNGGHLHHLATPHPGLPVWTSSALGLVKAHLAQAQSQAEVAGPHRRDLFGCVVNVLSAIGDSVGCASDVCEVIGDDGASLLDPFFDYDLVSGCYNAVHDWWTIASYC